MRPMLHVLALVAGLIGSQARADKVLLVPIDSRPAAGQFAQMIGKMANAQVVMPPYDSLGRFTRPGKPEAILDWLDTQDYRGVAAVVFFSARSVHSPAANILVVLNRRS